MTTPTIKQLLARVVEERFSWLLDVVTVASSKGVGLALRTRSGLLHLVGGPSDPGVHRVGDAGSAGTIELLGAPGAGTGFKWTAPDGVSFVSFSFAFTAGAVVVTAADQNGPLAPAVLHELGTKAVAGSERVTCA